MFDRVRRETGQAFPVVLMALGGGALMIGPLLGYVSTGLTGVRRGAEAAARYYAADAGVEHAMWRLRYGGLTLATDSPFTYAYSSVNGLPIDMIVVNKSPSTDAECARNQWPETQQERVTVARTVSPTTAPPGGPTTFDFSIRFRNVGTSNVHFYEIGATLPEGFTYVAGSAFGFTAGDPEVVDGSLVWEWDTPLPNIRADELIVLNFQAVGTLDSGAYCDYCDVSWVIFEPEGIGCIVYRAGERFNIRATAGSTYIQSAILISGGNVRVLSWETR